MPLLLRLAHAVDHENGLRILPMAGKGAVQTLTDLFYVRGVDAALVPSDTLAFMDRNGLLDTIGSKFAFVVRLYPLDVHVIAKSGINSLSDLDGKTVVVGPAASESYVAGQLLFGATGVSPKTMEASGPAAVRAVADGKADAAILVGRKPLPELKVVGSNSGLHLIDVGSPDGLQDIYAPSLVTHDDYPKLVTSEHPVETISAALIVAVLDKPRGTPQYARVQRFANGLFSALQRGDNEDASLNLAASVPGWNRHAAVESALKSHAEKLQAAATQSKVEN
jgi:TRAP-type uncharacterized transport system substrate-binding protein